MAGEGTDYFALLCAAFRRVVEHSINVDQGGRRRTQSDPGRGQSHAAVSTGRSLAAELGQSGTCPCGCSPGELQPDPDSDEDPGQQRHTAGLATAGTSPALAESESD